MKRTLSSLLALALTCSVLLSAFPALVGAAGYQKTWHLRDELAKATVTVSESSDKPDFGYSVFSVETTGDGGGAFSETPYATKVAGDGSFKFGRGSTNEFWKAGASVNADGSVTIGSEYFSKLVRLTFEAPVEGTYALIPEEIGATGLTATAERFDNHVKIYTDSQVLADVDILVDGSVDNFASDGEVWIDLRKGDKLFIEFDPKLAESYASLENRPGWVNHGICATVNFKMVLDTVYDRSSTYNTVYNPKDYIDSAVPANGIVPGDTDKTVVPVENDKWYMYDSNGAVDAMYTVETKNPWDVPNWAISNRFRKSDSSVAFAYADTNNNVGRYNVTLSKSSNSVTMQSWSKAVQWRVAFKAPESKTYYIDMSGITASLLTAQGVVFKIYKSDALAPDGSLSSDDAAIAVYDFYEDRTYVEYPCADGYIPVTMNAGEKLYFEVNFTAGSEYQSSTLAVSYTLNIKTDAVTTNNIVNSSLDITDDSVVLSKTAPTKQLSVNGVPGATVGTDIKWYSTDPSVATVDGNGLVTLASDADGFCKIVAQNEFTSDYCIVSTRALNSVTGVELNTDSVTMDKYDNVTLTYTVSPDTADVVDVSWSSSDEEVVRVIGGKLIYKGVGTATVTVNVNGKTDTCTVNAIEHVCDPNNATWTVTTPATCTGDGREDLLCNKCKASLDNRVIEHEGHDYRYEITAFPTWDEEGSRIVTCSKCDLNETETMPVGTVSKVEIVNNPVDIVYDLDETLDVTGLKVKVYYSNYEHTTEVTDFTDIEFTYDFSSYGVKTVSFEVAGKPLTFEVDVNEGGIVVTGDADGDGVVDVNDAMLIMRKIAGYGELSISIANSDINHDGLIDIGDVVLLLQMIVNA